MIKEETLQDLNLIIANLKSRLLYRDNTEETIIQIKDIIDWIEQFIKDQTESNDKREDNKTT